MSTENQQEIKIYSGWLRSRVVIPGLILLGLALYLPAVNWGLPALDSWSQDTIAGRRTLGAVEGWPGHWEGRYPPLHYLILRATYEPILRHWQATGQWRVDAETGRPIIAEPHPPKFGLLLLVGNLVSVVMGIGACIGVWCATLALSKSGQREENNHPNAERLAALFASLFTMLNADFAYFSRLGNVDVPCTCWIAWSLYFYAKALRTGSVLYCAALGLFGSLALSTKDSAAGLYPGMAISLLVFEFQRRAMGAAIWIAAWRTILQWKWLLGIGLFLAPYFLLNNVHANPGAYLERMRYWLSPGPTSLHAMQLRYDSSLDLAIASVIFAASAVGWHVVIAAAIAIVYTALKRTPIAIAWVLPCLSYYALIIERLDFVYARFLFPMMFCLAIPLGWSAARLTLHSKWPRWSRAALPIFLLVPSLGMCLNVALAMLHDTRYDAENWFRSHVPLSASIGATSKAQYLPRFVEMGYPTYRVEMTADQLRRPSTDYIVLSSHDYLDYSSAQRECMDALTSGQLAYEVVATFEPDPRIGLDSWLSFASRDAPQIGKISPTIIVMRPTTPP